MTNKKFVYSQIPTAIYEDVEFGEYVVNVASKNGQYVDVFLQDQTTETFAYYFKKLINYCTLSSNTSIGYYIIQLTAGHGVTNGEYLSILENDRTLQCKVINVNVNSITLDQPLDFAFTVSAEVRRTSASMNVNGSSTPVVFNVKPASCMKWHINQIILSILDNTEMDSGKFGGITSLTNGVVIRRKNSQCYNLLNAKSNLELDIKDFVVKYDSKAHSGSYGLTAVKAFNSQQGAGCAILIEGCYNDELQIIIQDDLSGLSSFNAVAIGHFVRD